MRTKYYMSRRELYERLGLVKVVDPITDDAYAEEEEHLWLNDLDSSPHGEHWHTSFHASSFPGDDQRACPRKALYTMMNVPNPKPTSRWLRQLADAGKDLETQIVSRWAKARRLVSVDQRGSDDDIQTGFVDKEHWLTGNTDAVLLPKGWDRLFPVEMKSKALERVIEMRRGQRGPDENQVRQAKTYIGFGAETLHERFPVLVVCKDTWKLVADDESCPVHANRKCLHEIKIKPTTSGSLYYYARDDPFVTHEYFLKADPYFMWQGRQKLAQWRDFFKDGTLPQSREKGGQHSHPFGWKWTELPCKYCSVKPICKSDHLEGITTLSDSCAVDAAEDIRPDYSYDETRKAVLNRWEGDSNG